MFGEDESESPRVPSPWDPFLQPSPPSEAASLDATRRNGIPKLVPEVEEGNVEYKLKLTHISPTRFARLVTQLKWRLLEGGGQAYYELGVADSGALIGLSRADLEQSLETLEMMAGEIGASVIVVKEIEVPPLMVALADKLSGYLDPETGEWADKMSSRRSRATLPSDGETSTTPNMTETETELSAAELTDEDGPSSCSSLVTPADSSRTSPHPSIVRAFSHRLSSSNPNRPTAQSSPFIAPIDDDLALFSMEPEPPHRVADDELELDPEPEVEVEGISVDIEISSVFKPRPMHKRVYPVHTSAVGTQHGSRRGHRVKEKRHHPWHTLPGPATSVEDSTVMCVTEVSATSTPSMSKNEVKALHRRQARDKRREEKRKTLLAAIPQTTLTDTINAVPNLSSKSSSGSGAGVVTSIVEETATVDLVSGLESLHVTMQASVVTTSVPTVDFLLPGGSDTSLVSGDSVEVGSSMEKVGPLVVAEETRSSSAKEPRLIVEALVVRKLSLEEAFLDFGGFSLT